MYNSNVNYRLIVIENSLKDKKILKKYKILSETIFAPDSSRESKMLKIEIPQEDVKKVSEILIQNIIHPYYAHLYHEDLNNSHLIILFKGKRFDEYKKSYPLSLSYGISHGVSKEEMIIGPTDISEEQW